MKVLTAERRTLEVQGRAAPVFGLRGPNGESGLTFAPGEQFRVRVDNQTGVPVNLHWHGQTPPASQADAATADRPPLPTGSHRDYRFAPRPGTHWVHAHDPAQAQQLLAALLVVRRPAEVTMDRQEVTILLHDFSFRDPGEIMATLAKNAAAPENPAAAGNGPAGGASPGLTPGMPPEITHDAWLANDRTLADPQVVPVERRGRLYLRIINGAGATGFHIDLGSLTGSAVAVDGNPIQPLTGTRFPLAQGQRLDLLVDLPRAPGVWPMLALREGGVERTGILLATRGAAIPRIPERIEASAPLLDPGFEERLVAVTPLPVRPPDTMLRVALTGSAAPYLWTIDGLPWGRHQPITTVTASQRVVLEMVNRSTTAQPMHLYGHHLQVLAINRRRIAGPLRDTVLVPATGALTVAFDAETPGRWPLVCTHRYRRAAGMMTELVYGPGTTPP